MNQEAESNPNRHRESRSRRRVAGLWTLASKELRETLRDRRTLMTLLMMPIIVYPLLGLMFQGFFLPSISQTEARSLFAIGFESESEFELFARSIPPGQLASMLDVVNPEISDDNSNSPESESKPLSSKWDLIVRDPTKHETLESMVASGEVDVGVALLEQAPQKLSWTLIVRERSANSEQASASVKRSFNDQNLQIAKEVLLREGIRHRDPIQFQEEVIASEVSAPISIVAIIPLILTLMTITGAVYPAIDLTAGERERGTLESLIAAPIPRLRILMGKFVAVVAVALLTALLNIIGMMTTLWVFQLETILFPDSNVGWLSFLKLFLLLIIFAGFFSSVLLAVTSFARSFKEGQAYLIPVMLFSIGPSLLSLKPELDLNGLLAIAPLVNIVLLARDVLQGTATLGPAIIAIGSTIIYSLLALSFASRVFGTDAVLYGSGGGWSEFLAPPKERQFAASESVAMLCVALLLPATFLWNGLVGRFADYGVSTQFGLVVLGLFIVFMAVPLAITTLRRVNVRTGYRLFGFNPVGLLAVILLGIGLGPIIAQFIAFSLELQEQWLGATNREELLGAAKEQVAKWRQLPWYFIIPGLSLVPAVVEEFFFRGCLFQALLRRYKPWMTILITAIVFGLFHLITAGSLGLSRLIPTTVMGIVLGWVCYRTGSVIPGMILHAIHNAIIVSLANFQEELIQLGWLTENDESIPWWVIAIAVPLSIVGLFVISRINPRPTNTDNKHSASDTGI